MISDAISQFFLLTNPDWHAETFLDIARYDLGDLQRYRGVWLYVVTDTEESEYLFCHGH